MPDPEVPEDPEPDELEPEVPEPDVPEPELPEVPELEVPAPDDPVPLSWLPDWPALPGCVELRCFSRFFRSRSSGVIMESARASSCCLVAGSCPCISEGEVFEPVPDWEPDIPDPVVPELPLVLLPLLEPEPVPPALPLD
ncbi:MAG: hypothetical protein SFV32_03740 [Opitutaceae bacterium]|nr:hypothetical protein [Opitutaceae bacterium]